MSSSIFYEFVLCCPHSNCEFKRKKFDSIESLNMHYAKIHSKIQKLVEIRDPKGRLRLILRMK